MTKQKIIQQKLAYEDWKRRRDAKSTDVKDLTPPEPEQLSPDQEERRRRNREKYPEIAAFVDEVRKVFPDARVVSITPYTPEEIEARRRSLASHGSDEPDETNDQQ